MNRKPLLLLLLLTLSLALAAGCGSDDPAAPAPDVADVDTYVKALPTWEEFSPPLASENVLLEGPVDSTQSANGQEYNCEVSRYSITETPREITVFSPDADILWPGSLLQGDKYAGGLGSLGELPIRQRAPLKVFIDLLTEGSARTVTDPDASTVATAVGALIQDATDAGHVAGSSIFFDQTTTHSLEQATLDLGISVNYMDTQVQSSLSYDESLDEHTLTAYFVQKMFTVSVVQPQTPSELFSADFTAARLQEQVDLGRIGPDNPPVYISSVVYGRMLMLTMTSSHSVQDMRAALTASREGIGSGSVAATHLRVLDESRIQVSTVGGVDDGVEGLITTGRLAEYFAADAPLTSARPLSYTVRNLADNSIATVAETTEYAINSCTPAERVPTGARYSIKVDKITLTQYGCDVFTAPAVECYYDFDLTTESGTTGLAAISASNWVKLEEGGQVNVNSPTRYVNLYEDGRGYMSLVGKVWDYDTDADDVIWNRTLTWRYDNVPTGQNYWTGSGNGCSTRVYVTISRVGTLYD